MIECAICKQEFEKRSFLSNHIKCHSIRLKEYYDKFLKVEGEGICKICGHTTRFNGLESGYSTYCSKKCISNCPVIRKKCEETSIKHYGVKNPIQSNVVKLNRIRTYQNKYNCDSYFQSREFKDQCIVDFGVDNPAKSDKIKEKNKKYFIENYGVENPLQCDKVKERSRLTCIKNHGVEYPFQNSEIIEKSKITCLKNHGVDNPAKSSKIQKIIRHTRVERGYWVSENQLSDYAKYRRQVNQFTSRSIRLKYTQNELETRGLGGKNGAMNIDHKFSIVEGFRNNILPCIIGSQCNLELIPWLENYKKHDRCSISKGDLCRIYEQQFIEVIL